MAMKQTLGDRMKSYENAYRLTLLPNAPFVVRLDGRGFSRYTKNMKFKKPFDMTLVKVMQEVTKEMVERNQAILGYTQSDEITLVFKPENTMFSGRIEKICSTFSAMTTLLFSIKLEKMIKEDVPDTTLANQMIENSLKLLPTFDCRVFSVPTKREALNAVLWREYDATKNSINVLAQSLFSHKELQNLNTKELQYKMLVEKDVNWNNLDLELKRGTYFIRKKITLNVPEILSQKDSCEIALNKYNRFLQNIPEKQLTTLDTFERSYIEQDKSFISMNEIFKNSENPESYFGFN